MLSIQIDAKSLELVIYHQFNNIKLSIFPLCTSNRWCTVIRYFRVNVNSERPIELRLFWASNSKQSALRNSPRNGSPCHKVNEVKSIVRRNAFLECVWAHLFNVKICTNLIISFLSYRIYNCILLETFVFGRESFDRSSTTTSAPQSRWKSVINFFMMSTKSCWVMFLLPFPKIKKKILSKFPQEMFSVDNSNVIIVVK